jgi:hypothetical protein
MTIPRHTLQNHVRYRHAAARVVPGLLVVISLLVMPGLAWAGWGQENWGVRRQMISGDRGRLLRDSSWLQPTQPLLPGTLSSSFSLYAS